MRIEENTKLYGFVVGSTMLGIVDDRTAFQQYAEQARVGCGTLVEWARLYNAFLLERAGWRKEGDGYVYGRDDALRDVRQDGAERSAP